MSTAGLPNVTVTQLITALRMQVGAQANLVLDSRDIKPGDVFLACPGLSTDGRDYIAQALAQGAVAVVYEAGLSSAQQVALGEVPAWAVEGLRLLLGEMSSQWWGRPSDALTVIAVTGTNGKTTTAQLLAAALRAAGKPCAVIGTLGTQGSRGELLHGVGLTTPDVVSLHRQLAQVKASGAEYLVMEASSIGLDQGRLDGVHVHTAIFTNLTQDHLDYHVDMQAYGQAKAKLFERCGLSYAVVNSDDPAAERMVQASVAPVLRYGMNTTGVDWCASDVLAEVSGTSFVLSHGAQACALQTALIGVHNVSNLLAVATTLSCLGWSFQDIAAVLPTLTAVDGRMEQVLLPAEGAVKASLPRVFVDYAHTPDALKKLLSSVREATHARGGKVWCVAGCGGDRDRSKRVLMGAVISELSDRFILTSDNPRHESPAAILKDVWQGVTAPEKGTQELERDVAILSAIWQADVNDVVLIAGKGHETYQQVGAVKRFFDDRQWARLGLLFYGKNDWQQLPVVTTDSRQVTADSCFVALKGERFDAHDFLSQVAAQGALAALVSRTDESLPLLQIQVENTREALQSLARAWRQRFVLPVIAVTGSNGKTTTKEMIAAILQQWVGAEHALATQGNLNNDLGVPLTLLRLRPWHQAAVIELGMNHPGEIAGLATLAAPTVALVLNAQREHQEFMQSVQAVAVENGQVLRVLPANGTAVFKEQAPYTELWASLSAEAARRWTFGHQVSASGAFTADVYARDLVLGPLDSTFEIVTPTGSQRIRLPVPGQHNIDNALASAACALAAGASLSEIAQGLEAFRAVSGRMQQHILSTGMVLIDDTYNANPDSVRAAIDVLQTLPQPRALILGDMGEVGENGPAMHAEVGKYARERGIEWVWTLGQATAMTVEAFGSAGRRYDDVTSLIAAVREQTPASVLVKGSRFMAMERVVAALTAPEQLKQNKNKGEQSHVG